MKNFNQYAYVYNLQNEYLNEYSFILKDKKIQEELFNFLYNNKKEIKNTKLKEILENSNFKYFLLVKYYLRNKEYGLIIPIYKQQRISYHNIFFKGLYGYISQDNNKSLINLFKIINENVYDYSVTLLSKNLFIAYINGTNEKNIAPVEKIYELRDKKILNKSNINSNGPYKYVEFKINQKIPGINCQIDSYNKKGFWHIKECKVNDKIINEVNIDLKAKIYYYFDLYYTKYINYNPLSKASEKEWRKLFDIEKN